MKIAAIVVRSLMGLLFLFASITYFFDLFPKPELTGSIKVFQDGMEASIYLVFLVKAVEFVCGVAFVSGRFVTLACVLISPIIVNIFLFHAFLDPTGLPVAVALVGANLFLAYVYRDNYRSLFAVK